MDVDSRPEEVDFEGINGQILVQQSQIHFFPRLGQNMSFKIALENPQTDVVNGLRTFRDRKLKSVKLCATFRSKASQESTYRMEWRGSPSASSVLGAESSL